MWTALINQDSNINAVKVTNGYKLGIIVSSGPALCEHIFPKVAENR